VVIPTLNEEFNIAECVATARFADEVLVADAGSSDGTVAAARAAGATVLERAGSTIAGQRNAAIAAARHRWIFALDADERITPALAAELGAVLSAPAHEAYRVRCQNFYLGVEQTRGGWSRDWHVRLFGSDRRYVERRVHEGLEPVADVGELQGTLLHHPYRSLAHHLEKMSRYAQWGATDLWDRGRRASWTDLSVRPAWRFIQSYLLEGGLLAGRAGLVQATLGAYSGFLKYAYLWARERNRG
jgi:glycosyltransferase involved in cell wall biosynthesis